MELWSSVGKEAWSAEEYAGLPVYRYISVPTMKWCHRHRLQLRAVEVFYLTFYMIDELVGMEHMERKHYCREALWDEVIDMLGFRPAGTSEEEEAQRMSVALVAAAIVHCLLLCCDKIPWLQTGNALLEVLTSHLTETQSTELHKYFITSMTNRQEKEVADWMEEYLRSDRCLSDEINDRLTDMQAAVPQPQSAPSTIRIAPHCKSKVLVMLDAMYNAGWLVNEQGQRLTNRDKALNEILSLAFGEKKWTVIRNSICPNKVSDCDKRNAGYFRELEAYMSKEEDTP